MDRLINIMTGFSILLILMVLLSVRRAHIRVEYSVSWLAAALVLLTLSLWRTLLDRIAGAMGITDAPVALLVLTGALFVVVLFRLSMMISSLKDANIALAQHLAILEYRLESHEEAKTPRS